MSCPVTPTGATREKERNVGAAGSAFLATMSFLAMCSDASARIAALRLHPDNPHYFLFRDKPAILITSGEHYGAVLNADFDYTKYLDTLAADGLNHTRIFVGAYCEPAGAFNIAENTLAPAPGRFISPWARSDAPGYANGGNRFDLTRWDEAYFKRLKDFVAQAGQRGIVVEINLFCPFYLDDIWSLSPMNAGSNINNVGAVPREDVYTLDKHGGLLAVQEAMVRKVVTELKDCDNIFYEIMNEPYNAKVPMAWQEHIIDVIVAAEKEAGVQHLISLNIANGKEKVERAHPAVSILNFHYAWPPDAVTMNFDLKCLIGDNETGGHDQSDFTYRREGWAFVLAGGGLYNNLDYSFAAGHEDGTFKYPREQPGGGSAALRRQLGVLSRFIHGFDFVRMTPDTGLIQSALANDLAAFALSEPGRQYAVYLCRTGKAPAGDAAAIDLSLALPAGRYQVQWINTLSGEVDWDEIADHGEGLLKLKSPAVLEDVALRIVRV